MQRPCHRHQKGSLLATELRRAVGFDTLAHSTVNFNGLRPGSAWLRSDRGKPKRLLYRLFVAFKMLPLKMLPLKTLLLKILCLKMCHLFVAFKGAGIISTHVMRKNIRAKKRRQKINYAACSLFGSPLFAQPSAGRKMNYSFSFPSCETLPVVGGSVQTRLICWIFTVDFSRCQETLSCLLMVGQLLGGTPNPELRILEY